MTYDETNMALISRSTVFAILFVWMAAGPFYVQVLGVRNEFTQYIREWIMFSGRGIGFVETRYFQKMPDGSERDLDRFELLGFPVPRKAPLWLWRTPHAGRARSIAVQLCAKLEPGADVRLVARLATMSGWKTQFDGSHPWCRGRVRPQEKRP